ncbi:MAG: type I-C CRISPR-associated endonuclease Cas1c [Muribaculaceae bacterium]|nr:type I-C CRISPR-associated endonuclease Cas1c [Muribaculaceae bacterium]
MKKLLNTLYVTTPESYLSKDGNNVVISVDGKEIFRIPITNLESICTFSYSGASPGLMRLCSENGVALSFFSPHGKFIARTQGPVKGNVLLRLRQYGILNDEAEKRRLASRFTYGKLFNSRVVLRRFVRDYPDNPAASKVASSAEKLRQSAINAAQMPQLDTMRGIEGDGAAEYFEAFPHLILSPEPEFAFKNRNRRPPKDPVNAMLSMGYSLLSCDCASALEGVGLDPAMGFMHALRPGRNSLALDLMEEMRAYIVDRLVLSLVNTRQISPSDFKIHTDASDQDQASVIFTDNGLKKFLSAWQAKKKTEFTHPFLNEKIKLGLLPHAQAMLLARNLRGDIDDYPVFLTK